MLNKLFPPAQDFVYRGSRIALWLLGFVIAFKIAIALGSTLNTYYAATSADGIPLDRFSPEAVSTILTLFKLLGIAQLCIALIGAVIVFRYRALVPALALLLIVEYFARRVVIGLAEPSITPTTITPGLIVNLVLLAMMVIAFGLSLMNRRKG
jgi:hypothetical protein